MDSFDFLVIGSGQGGIPFANAKARAGHRVALFERGRLGGSCVNNGCTPSKTLLAAAHAAAAARRSRRLGIRSEVTVDFPAVMRRVRDVRDQWRAGVNRTEQVENLTVVRGEAKFVEPRVVEAAGMPYTAPVVVINTGTSPKIPPIENIDAVECLTNETVFDLTERPDRLLVVGGGYIGCEIGQAMADLGCAVHLVDPNDRPLHVEEPQVGRTLAEQFEADGMHLHFGRRIRRVEREGGATRATLDDGATIEGDAVLIAAGRTPNTAALNPAAAGIELDAAGYVKIDERFSTTADGVYAIGDVAGQPAFTHVAYEDHRRLLNILDGGDRSRDDRALAYACFTHPQVGRCGLSEQQAIEAGFDVRVERKDLAKAARGVEWGFERGSAHLIVDRDTDRLLGVTIVAHEAGELVHMFIPPIQHRMTWRQVSETVPIHPTFGEAMHSLTRQYEKR